MSKKKSPAKKKSPPKRKFVDIPDIMKIKKKSPAKKKSKSPAKKSKSPVKRKFQVNRGKPRRARTQPLPSKRGRFARHSPKRLECVNYQKECKGTKFGNVYNNRCNIRNSINYNLGLRNQASKCAKLRRANRKCRIANGQPATPKHDFAIYRVEENAKECDDIAFMQQRPNTQRFRRNSPKFFFRARNF